MLGLHLLEVCSSLLLGECLPQYGLMPLITRLLILNIVEIVFITWLTEEGLVFIHLGKLSIFSLLQLSLSTLLELIGEGYGHILSPQSELGL